ncbi:MAG TPA: SMC family ATPase [Candidatus Enterocloster faecavium]|uniref:Nuclease SbcCD subunit C n=1 Tax=Candidatus Enterocloster faecavium TaxID=2838560 RepID=A0A9D2L5D5_9FIRM|nr:SMC family ATPase [Candidatus Enterocloster faecavium]
MKPLKLMMEAFGSYGRRTVIDFEKPDQNLFLITGDTGAGKTTIFDAIVFALYGEASSNVSRKDGAELQSQFALPQTVPFVELTFSEGRGEAKKIYTVRRTPRHRRPLKRGTGMKDVSETVSLQMPDGSEYPSKETDRKLVELVGLTKAQFMQVAMIAQGEFMEFLRARSDDKKAIFRKLFHTGQYQEIVEELGKRRKAKEEEIRQIKAACRLEAARIQIPQDYDRAQELCEQKERITQEEVFVKEDLEQLTLELEMLRSWLDIQRREAEENAERLGKLRDEKRDELTQAKELSSRFEQLKKAEEQLRLCDEQKEEMERTWRLAGQIQEAYQMEELYERYIEAMQRTERIREQMEKEKEQLPGLEKNSEEAAAQEEDRKKILDQETENFNRISDRVNRAMKVLQELSAAGEDIRQGEKLLVKAQEDFTRAEDQVQELERREEQWRNQERELQSIGKELALWQSKKEETARFIQETDSLRKMSREAGEQEKEAREAQSRYTRAREEYREWNAQYEALRQRFLDGQAGLLARELKPGKPCPVCGSTVHPSPCTPSDENIPVERRELEELEEKTGILRTRQEELAARASSSLALLEEKKQHIQQDKERLQKELESLDWIGGVCGTLKEWEEKLGERAARLKEEGERLKEKEKRHESLLDALSKVEGQRKQRKEALERARMTLEEVKTRLDQSRAKAETYEKEKEYPDEGTARGVLSEAKRRKTEAESRWNGARQQAQSVRERLGRAKTLVGRFEAELPDMMLEEEKRKQAYQDSMEKKGWSQEQWQSLTFAYAKEASGELSETVQSYKERRAGALARIHSLAEAIGQRSMPDLKELEESCENAKRQMEESRQLLERRRREYETIGLAYEAMVPSLEKRRKAVGEYERLDRLYRILSGNKTGSRMDLETYVQRRYLEQILERANRRFRDMSGGQFELRMYQLEKAGEGKNRGLDLMVYSALTGKEREIRTLSGGESFMAALSLALGMADRIQAGSGAVNLDILFIDEGFGSLDERSRDQAVKVLQEMAEGSRLVGIISHVTELKQEIEDQLIVTRDEKGSQVQWKIS